MQTKSKKMEQLIALLPGKLRWNFHADYRKEFKYTSRDTLRRRISREVILQRELNWAVKWAQENGIEIQELDKLNDQ